MKNIKLLAVFILSVLLIIGISSCEKTEGEGGTSSISGKVRVIDYNSNFTLINSEYYAQESRVYIIYGDDITHSRDVRTNFDGTFRFSFLKKGTYHIYAYSKDSSFTSPSGYIPIIVSVDITKNNQHIEVDDIVVLD